MACPSPSRHFPPVVVSLLAKQASCFQHHPRQKKDNSRQDLKRTPGLLTPVQRLFSTAIMDEEYYSGAGDWEGTEGNMVRSQPVAVGRAALA